MDMTELLVSLAKGLLVGCSIAAGIIIFAGCVLGWDICRRRDK